MYEHQCGIPVRGDFHLVPVATGGKGRTGKIVLTIVIGGALLATGVGGALGAFGAGATGLYFSGTAIGVTFGTMALMGAGLVLGGLSMLLAPTPKTDTTKDDGKPTTFTFAGPITSIDEGNSIPLIYGEIICGAATVASDIRNGVSQLGPITVPPAGTGGAGGADPGEDAGGWNFDGTRSNFGYYSSLAYRKWATP